LTDNTETADHSIATKITGSNYNY